MANADLYIVAAGIGSRLCATVPKALVPICHEPCITSMLRLIGPKFRRVFVVTNVLALKEWSAYLHRLVASEPELARHTRILPIESGLGDGHATLQGLLAAETLESADLADDVVVIWGDVFLPQAQIIDELLSMPLNGSGLFPVVHESRPYVALQVDERMHCLSADFSKHGETHLSGLHDQSVFRFQRSRLRAALQELHNCLWKNGRYITPGAELSLLHSVHQLYNSGTPVCAYETRYAAFSFNTAEEIAAIQRQLGIVRAESGRMRPQSARASSS